MIFPLLMLVIPGLIIGNFSLGTSIAYPQGQVLGYNIPTGQPLYNTTGTCPNLTCNFSAPIFFLPQTNPTSCIVNSFYCFVQPITGLQNYHPNPFEFFLGTAYYAVCANVAYPPRFNGTSGPYGSSVGVPPKPNVFLFCNNVLQNGTGVSLANSQLYNQVYNCTFSNPEYPSTAPIYFYWYCTFLPSHSGGSNVSIPTSAHDILFSVFDNNGKTPNPSDNWDLCSITPSPVQTCDVTGSFVSYPDASNLVNCPFQVSSSSSSPSAECTQLRNSEVETNVGTNLTPDSLFAIGSTLGIIAGVIFLIIGLGIGFNIGIFTNTFGVKPNSQGTKFAQAFGAGLLLWFFCLNVFGFIWINMLGKIGIDILTLLTITFFIGVFWRVQSLI